ncbi:LIPOATE-PROTEIN LIGASE A [Mycoplasmopsis pulmonis]|uniref:lipoate--protein ligase n=1 Tax=Mycoplasmopsis pulmonis (strain UAB CTIP) TaxID=272635 RepID=Q98QC3_MYCPU|nr:lipoate--protein ligase [Mycoplasmopsis pulmonis]MDZ7293546.1 lipoate--protein ligase [Mycoplasmopsis pulmonis]CAC13616.1 LIPOATE-PROTEIN LIGASE A [Mycoplasmopsis pulmonis]VEU68208.1 Lipoate-protein ligase A [Mycoplasmopsis pulmonis]
MYLIEPIRNGKYIKDGAYAMALQAYALTHLKLERTAIFPYICDAHIQIGYFQNPEVEVNFPYLKEHNIPIVRRRTGGGAIYIDDKSVNICWLYPFNSENNKNIFGNYQKFYEPIVEILKELGVKNLVYSGKNDLHINGKKVSGAAMMLQDDYIYGGYSLLWNLDFEAIGEVLRPSKAKIKSKSIESVRQRVDYISQYVDDKYKNLSSQEFKKLVLDKLSKYHEEKIEIYELSEQDWKNIDELVEKRYKNWDWTFGLSPRYEFNREARFDIGTFGISLKVDQGKIQACKISGDFFAKENLQIIEKALLQKRLIKEELMDALKDIDFQNFFFKPIDPEKIVDLILS